MIALGIEIGGTKLQAGIGDNQAGLLALVRRTVDPHRGAPGIRDDLPTMVDEAIRVAGCAPTAIVGVGIGFGGPYDTTRDVALHSFQIEGCAEGVYDAVGQVPAAVQRRNPLRARN